MKRKERLKCGSKDNLKRGDTMNKKEKKKANKKFYENHKDYFKRKYLENREKNLQNMKKYYINNPERWKKYYKTKTYKKYLIRHRKLRKELGFFPLNKRFDGCVSHHISLNFVIFIPKELHKSIRHNLRTGKNMEAINKFAIKFL